MGLAKSFLIACKSTSFQILAIDLSNDIALIFNWTSKFTGALAQFGVTSLTEMMPFSSTPHFTLTALVPCPSIISPPIIDHAEVEFVGKG